MPNIKFSYLYRDSGNYKIFGSTVFANSSTLSLLEIESAIRSILIDELWFYTNEWGVPDLFPKSFDPYNDSTWHEFESVEFTDELVNRERPYRVEIASFFAMTRRKIDL